MSKKEIVMKNLWAGRFSKSAEPKLQEYWNSIGFDWKLLVHDITGSLAHCRMLAKCGIITAEEGDKITLALKELLREALNGKVEFALEDEDIHMNVERLLHESIGPLAGKLHTARSRNDQVAVDMHLYVREKTIRVVELLMEFANTLLAQAAQHKELYFSGYTHLQRAQPVLFSHHLLAYVFMFIRDAERFRDSYSRTNTSPLGAGAIAGTTFPIDRIYSAELLGFDGIYQNSMDAVSDRDFVVEFMAASALVSMHLSRFCEEVVLWSSYEFGFITLDDAFSTGSSMMPQKKNPDLAELVRGKTGRVYGNLLAILTALKGLPLTYNKDMQEDKEALFDTVETVDGALFHLSGMTASWQVNRDRMSAAASGNFTNATDLADYLAKKGTPFREAHEIAGNMVRYCLSKGKELDALSLDEFKKFSNGFEMDIFDALKIENIIARRRSLGGTAPESVELQLNAASGEIKVLKEWAKTKRSTLESIKL